MPELKPPQPIDAHSHTHAGIAMPNPALNAWRSTGAAATQYHASPLIMEPKWDAQCSQCLVTSYQLGIDEDRGGVAQVVCCSTAAPPETPASPP